MNLTWVGGCPLRDGAPVVLLVTEYQPTGGWNTLRAEARELAEWGVGGLRLRGPATEAIRQTAEAARRVGLAVVTDEPLDLPHATCFADLPDAVEVADDWDACLALAGGARVIVGPREALGGALTLLDLAGDPAAWRPLEAPAGWRRAGTEEEWLACGPAGSSYEFATPPGTPRAVEWVAPDGARLARTLLAPGERHRCHIPEGQPGLVLIYGRPPFEPDEQVTSPWSDD